MAVAAANMVSLAGGTFQMGSERFYPEERPVRRASVEAFAIDVHPVTNEQFAQFVAATGYVTLAERPVAAADYPGADPALLVPGSAVFTPPPGPVPLRDPRLWWRYVPFASWHAPAGPGSDLGGRERHPVVHVAHEDAGAYAAWAGKALPTEPEWEFAACGSLEAATYAWGEDPSPGGRVMANTWAGRFPWENLRGGGFEFTSPVQSFPPNGYGLYDMTGNVWEWTADSYGSHGGGGGGGGGGCCGPGPAAPRRLVVKGGSHLCAPNYCLRYRPAARQGQTPDTSTSHIGFRCVVRSATSLLDEAHEPTMSQRPTRCRSLRAARSPVSTAPSRKPMLSIDVCSPANRKRPSVLPASWPYVLACPTR
jgi:formylglycine-generating enzyme